MTESKEYFERALAEVDALPPISSVLHKVLELTEGEGDHRGELVRCVSLDQAIAAKVLQNVNSAYYGLQQKISSIEVAVGLLGDKKVREIAILCSAAGVLRRGVLSYGIMPDEFWLHSIATGISARLLAEIYAPEMCDEAFTAGLLHDIGKLAINRVIEEEHKETIRDTGEGPSPDYYSREMGLYGFDHCTIGFFLARNWNFSEEMTQAIAFHHYPDQESEHQNLIRIICTADFVAHLVASGEDEARMIEILEKEGMVPLDLSRPDIEKIISTLKKETSDSEAFLGI